MKTSTKFLTLAALAVAAVFAGGAPAKADGYCREYTRTVYIGGAARQAYGTACLGPDGAWRIADENLTRGRARYVPAYASSEDTVVFNDTAPVPVITQQVQYVPAYPPQYYYRPVYQPVYYQPAPAFVFSFGGGHDRWHHYH